MTTPRDPRLHGVAIMPAFVEFDMSAEGFGALFLPSIPRCFDVSGNNGSSDSTSKALGADVNDEARVRLRPGFRQGHALAQRERETQCGLGQRRACHLH